MLQDSADVSARLINHQADGKVCLRMLKLGGSGQGCLGGVEGLPYRWRPSQGLARALKCVGQRKEKTGCASQKPVLEVHEAKEMLKIEGCQRAWKLDDWLHVAREGADSGGRNPMSQKLHLLLAEDRLLRVDGETILT